ncbi:hypothetical protein MCU_01541 [Bartonella elizabethae Re6043vi]|uniref:Uncharacterized protein n=2 Tax=Bartonella elizabethae TaxID=807 RepID=J1K4Z7_BAREL|nr:hypothetical protein MCU_01541 [Bartonella elizabethae Re6043vi]EJF92255.1 hypothetical protein MEE_01609 [Bartonella elizabethae F9251 = ATCC 49927]VEJ41752.1 Uncharacterised protein [Bartonella elizabethae]
MRHCTPFFRKDRHIAFILSIEAFPCYTSGSTIHEMRTSLEKDFLKQAGEVTKSKLFCFCVLPEGCSLMKAFPSHYDLSTT